MRVVEGSIGEGRLWFGRGVLLGLYWKGWAGVLLVRVGEGPIGEGGDSIARMGSIDEGGRGFCL